MGVVVEVVMEMAEVDNTMIKEDIIREITIMQEGVVEVLGEGILSMDILTLRILEKPQKIYLLDCLAFETVY